jgi:hypothetical protein
MAVYSYHALIPIYKYNTDINIYSIYAQYHMSDVLTTRFRGNKEQNEVVSSVLDFFKSGIKQKNKFVCLLGITLYGYHGSGAM